MSARTHAPTHGATNARRTRIHPNDPATYLPTYLGASHRAEGTRAGVTQAARRTVRVCPYGRLACVCVCVCVCALRSGHVGRVCGLSIACTLAVLVGRYCTRVLVEGRAPGASARDTRSTRVGRTSPRAALARARERHRRPPKNNFFGENSLCSWRTLPSPLPTPSRWAALGKRRDGRRRRR